MCIRDRFSKVGPKVADVPCPPVNGTDPAAKPINGFNPKTLAKVTPRTSWSVTNIVCLLYTSINYLIDNGDIDINQFKELGIEALKTGSEAFLRGTIAALSLIHI